MNHFCLFTLDLRKQNITNFSSNNSTVEPMKTLTLPDHWRACWTTWSDCWAENPSTATETAYCSAGICRRTLIETSELDINILNSTCMRLCQPMITFCYYFHLFIPSWWWFFFNITIPQSFYSNFHSDFYSSLLFSQKWQGNPRSYLCAGQICKHWLSLLALRVPCHWNV